MGKKILIIDDDQLFLDLVEIITSDLGWSELNTFTDPTKGVKHFHSNPGMYHGVILDILMPGKNDGIKVARKLREKTPSLPIVFLSAYKKDMSDNVRDSVDELGNVLYVEKPFQPKDLKIALVKMFGRAA